jgi:hypothetical protein
MRIRTLLAGLCLAAAALLSFAATLATATPPTAAHPTTHTTVAKATTTNSVAYDVCAFTNPNPSGYAVTHWALDDFYPLPRIYNANGVNIHQHLQVWCHWHPFVYPNYGELCEVFAWHNNPTNYLPPGEPSGVYVQIGLYSCPNEG